MLATAISTHRLHPTQADLDAAAAGFRDNPAAIAFNGPDLAIDTVGGQTVFQMSVLALGLVGLMNILLVSRLTRGRRPAAGSSPSGRSRCPDTRRWRPPWRWSRSPTP